MMQKKITILPLLYLLPWTLAASQKQLPTTKQKACCSNCELIEDINKSVMQRNQDLEHKYQILQKYCETYKNNLEHMQKVTQNLIEAMHPLLTNSQSSSIHESHPPSSTAPSNSVSEQKAHSSRPSTQIPSSPPLQRTCKEEPQTPTSLLVYDSSKNESSPHKGLNFVSNIHQVPSPASSQLRSTHSLDNKSHINIIPTKAFRPQQLIFFEQENEASTREIIPILGEVPITPPKNWSSKGWLGASTSPQKQKNSPGLWTFLTPTKSTHSKNTLPRKDEKTPIGAFLNISHTMSRVDESYIESHSTIPTAQRSTTTSIRSVDSQNNPGVLDGSLELQKSQPILKKTSLSPLHPSTKKSLVQDKKKEKRPISSQSFGRLRSRFALTRARYTW